MDKATDASPNDTTLLLHTAWMYSVWTAWILPPRLSIIGPGLITSWDSRIQWLVRQRWWPIKMNVDRLGMFNLKETGPLSSWLCIALRTICIVWSLIARVLKLIGKTEGKDWLHGCPSEEVLRLSDSLFILGLCALTHPIEWFALKNLVQSSSSVSSNATLSSMRLSGTHHKSSRYRDLKINWSSFYVDSNRVRRYIFHIP